MSDNEPVSEGATGGCALPNGWSEMVPGASFRHESGATVYRSVHGGWGYWLASGTEGGAAPTILQAMCAALGLRISMARGRFWCGDTMPENAADALAYDDIDDCAREALERFHARQQAPASPLARIFGRWPGDETDEQLLAAMREDTAPAQSIAERNAMRPATSAAPTVERLLELAAEALKAAGKAREAALELEGLAARIRDACARAAAGGER